MDDEQLYLEIILDAKARIDALKEAGLTSKELREEFQKMQKMYPQLRGVIEKENKNINSSIQKLKNGFSTVINKIKQTGKIINQMYNQSRKAMLALVALTTLAIGGYASFQKEMALTNTMLNVSREEIKKYEKTVMDMSSKSGRSANELAKALYDIRSAGVANEDTIEVLKKVQIAATAGATDVNTAAKAGIATINSYGLKISELDRIFDLQFSTVKQGIITYEQLANNIGTVLPAASKLGVELEEVYGALAFVTKMGISAEEGSTALARSFDALISKSGNLKEIGINIYNLEGKFKGYEKVIEELAEKLRGLSDEEKNNVLENIGFDIRATRMIIPAINNLNEFKKTLDEVKNSSGATKEAWKKATDNIADDFNILKSSIKNSFMGIGALFEKETRLILQSLSNIINKFNNMSEEAKIDIKNTITKIGFLIIAITGIGTAIKLLMNPITKIGIILGVTIASAIVIWNNFKKLIETGIGDIDEKMKKYADRWKTALKLDVVIESYFNEADLKMVNDYEKAIKKVYEQQNKIKPRVEVDYLKDSFKLASKELNKFGIDSSAFRLKDDEIIKEGLNEYRLNISKNRYKSMIETIIEARKRIYKESESITDKMEGKEKTIADKIADELKDIGKKVKEDYSEAFKQMGNFFDEGANTGVKQLENLIDLLMKLGDGIEEIEEKSKAVSNLKIRMPNVYGTDIKKATEEGLKFKEYSNPLYASYMRNQSYTSRHFSQKTRTPEELEKLEYEAEYRQYYIQMLEEANEKELEEKRKQLEEQKRMTQEIRNAVSNVFSNLATLTGNEGWNKINSGLNLVWNGIDSFKEMDFSKGFSKENLKAGMNIAGAAIGVVSTIDSYFSEKQEKENQRQIAKYDENTSALTELTTRIQQLNESLIQFDRNSIQTLAQNPTDSNIAGYSKNYQIMLDTINKNKDFGDVSILADYKYKDWKFKYKHKYKEIGLDDEVLASLSGYDLQGKKVEDLNLSELKEYRKSLNNIDESTFESIAKGEMSDWNSSQWASLAFTGGIGALFGVGDSEYAGQENNYNEYLKNIDEYIAGVERLEEAQKNLRKNSILESFEGINVVEQQQLIEQYTKQLEDTYKIFYNTEDIEEYREEIEETAKTMAENADVMVTAMNDVRSATVTAMNEGKDALESFFEGLKSFTEKIKNNVSQIIYNVSFGNLDEEAENVFKIISEKLAGISSNGNIIEALIGNPNSYDNTEYSIVQKKEQLEALNNQYEIQMTRLNELETKYNSGLGPFGMFREEYEKLKESVENTNQSISNLSNQINDMEGELALKEWFESIAEAEKQYEGLSYTIQNGDWAGKVVDGSQAAIEAMKDIAREVGLSEETIQAMFGQNEWEKAASNLRENVKTVIEAGFGSFDEFSGKANEFLASQLKEQYINTDSYKKLQEDIAKATEEYLAGKISIEEYRESVEEAYNDKELEKYRDTIKEVTEEIDKQSKVLEKVKEATLKAYEAYSKTGNFRDFTVSFGESLYQEGLTSLQELFADTALIETFAKTLFDKEKIQAEIDEIMNNANLTDIEKQKKLAELYQSTEQTIKDNIRGLGYDFTADDITNNTGSNSSQNYGSEYYTGSSLAGAGQSANITYSITIHAENIYNDSASKLADDIISKIEKSGAGDL